VRWLFHDPDDRREAVARKRILGRIADWWDAFESKSKAIGDLFAGKRKWDLPEWMSETLGAVNPDLCWEYGPAVETKGHRLVITPESRKYLRPLVRAILDRAPDLPDWEFYAYRLAENLEQAQAATEGRTGGTLEGVVVEMQIGAENRIDLLFRSPVTEDENDQKALNIALVATETLLGERTLDRWVGAIEAASLPAGETKGKRSIPLSRFKDTFDSLVESIRDGLPGKPYLAWIAKAKWSMLELKPEPADDYLNCDDLIVATTTNVEMWKAAHSGRPFYSQRFSRCKETFAYVKLDSGNRRRGREAEDRGKIEDAIDDALLANDLGVHVGGGTGLRYSYIDLALTDLERGVERVRRTLRKLGVDERTWILFFDADLAAEWVGVYPETPEPPMAEEEE
jgi:hypothetical protein